MGSSCLPNPPVRGDQSHELGPHAYLYGFPTASACTETESPQYKRWALRTYFNGPIFKGPNIITATLPRNKSAFLPCSQTFFSDQSDRGVIDEVRVKFEKADQIYGIATEFSRDEESVGC